MKKILKKWEGGAKKHGGIGNAMVAQLNVWTAEEESRKAEELRIRSIEEATLKQEAEERAATAEALAKSAIERNEKLKAELREAQAKLAMEQAAREEQELLDQLKQMQLGQKAIEEEELALKVGSQEVVSDASGDEEIELALALSMEVTPKKEIEVLAKKLVAKTIDVNAIKLTQEKFSLLEEVCMEQFSFDAYNSGVKVLLEGLDASLNIIESNIIGEV